MRRLSILLSTLLCSCLTPVSVGDDDQTLRQSVAASQQVCAAQVPFAQTRVLKQTHCLHWPTRTLSYAIEAKGNSKTPGDSELDAVDRAFASWNTQVAACSDLAFSAGPRVQSASVAPDGVTQVLFRETSCDTVDRKDPCWTDLSCGNKYKCWAHSSGTQAQQTMTFRDSTGLVEDADIELNAANFSLTTVDSPPCGGEEEGPSCVAADVQAMVTHQIGHILGLDHSTEPTSTMAPTAPKGDTSKRALDNGTLCFACKMYQRGAPSPDCLSDGP